MHYKGDETLYNWIATDSDLRDAVARWPTIIGLDTEFIRTDTYYPLPGLYQVAAGDEVDLIDPLAIEDWRPFVQYLAAPGTVQVMHACQEDLELLHHHLGVAPQNIFDTQFANAYACADYSLSYAALVERVLQVSLTKHETRSNWLQRPLTENQIRYAVEDVTYLIPLYESLRDALREHDRESWFAADMPSRGNYSVVDPRQYYRNVKKGWQLQGSQLAVLQHLCAWRESTARSENVPRNRVIWDDHLFSFAQVDELEEHHVRDNLPRGVVRRYGERILGAHNEGRDGVAPESLPRPLTTSQGKLLKEMRAVANVVAAQLEVAPELLSRKRDLEACIRHFTANSELSPHYNGWREPLVGADFLTILGVS